MLNFIMIVFKNSLIEIEISNYLTLGEMRGEMESGVSLAFSKV